MLATTLACGTAHAGPRIADRGVLMPTKTSSTPYRVELVGSWGQKLQTFHHRGRFYVLGAGGERYSIRVHNPTGRRVEAVVSVDGLDVIDGQTANYRTKRGYVVPPYESITIEGFRTSTSNVAAFRFSSVSGSYAGRKGKARNVGVIGVAIFEEEAEAALIEPHPHHRHHRPHYGDYRDYLAPEERGVPARPSPPRSAHGSKKSEKEFKAPAPRQSAPAAEDSVAGSAAPSRRYDYDDSHDHGYGRAGLGTEFGERRYSNVSWTRFQRKSNSPSAMAVLRYNNATGLAALGIHIHHYLDDEVATRETADPFPTAFAEPPGY